jgi:hypothetical protein
MPTQLQATLALFLTLSIASAQVPAWRQHATSLGPSAYGGTSMACDHLRDRVVLFGGGIGYATFNWTSLLDGDTWTYVPTTIAPPPRSGQSMAFDERRGEVVMYGGFTLGQGMFTDTWVWTGQEWQQRFPQHTPPSSWFGSLTYDEARERCVLFSGQETWEWDGTDWLQRTPAHSPSPRNIHGAAYDSWRERVVVFGGNGLFTGAELRDTWEWDGVDWQQITAVGVVPSGYGPSMAFDRERGVCVMVTYLGGYEYDGATWTTTTAPGGITDGMVYDRQRGRMVSYSGADPSYGPYTGTTWSYEDPTMALAQPFGQGCGNPPLQVRENNSARPLLGSTLSVDVQDVPAGIVLMAFGWSNRQALALPLPFSMAPLQLPGCWWLQSGEVISLACTLTGPTTASFSLPIPSSTAYLSQQFYLQPWAPAPGLNPANGATGNGLAVRMGTW